MGELYTSENLLDRLSDPRALEAQDEREKARERALVARRLGLAGGDAISVGCGWHPGRHLLPAPAWRLVAVDMEPDRARVAVERGEADEGFPGRAGELSDVPADSFDVVLYRYVLHHVAYHQPLEPVFAEAARLLRPGGAVVAIEPNLWHPIGAALAAANRLGLGVRVHGTPDDIPLSPRRLMGQVREAGLAPELHSVSYSWRRLPARGQRILAALDGHGSRRGLRALGHTVLLIARAGG